MKFSRRDNQEDVRLDLTPLVDCVLQLIIFFMLTSAFVALTGVKVSLPKATPEAIRHQREELQVSITREGKVFLEKREVSLEDLREIFASRAKRAPETLVVVNADRECHHGLVVEVLDLAKTSGLKNLAIATLPKPKR